MDLEADMDADTVDGRDLSDDITGMDEGTTSSPVDMVSEPSMTRIPVQETPVQQPTTKKGFGKTKPFFYLKGDNYDNWCKSLYGSSKE